MKKIENKSENNNKNHKWITLLISEIIKVLFYYSLRNEYWTKEVSFLYPCLNYASLLIYQQYSKMNIMNVALRCS